MTTESFVAYSAQPLPVNGKVPDRIHLLPFGRHVGRDGRGPYVLRDMAHAKQVIAATVAHQRGADLPIDYEHQSQLAPPSVSARPAAGWIKANNLEVGPNGIWGKVEWTATASQHIDRREYRYISPVFRYATNGAVARIVGAALTNFPNLELTALASQGATMDTLTSAKALLGLNGADDATFLRTCDDLVKLTKAIVVQFGLAADTSPAELLDALMQRANAATATASQAPDLSASIAAIQAVANQAETYRQQISQVQVETAVATAMATGKISPAMREWATALASQNPDSFQAFMATIPPIFAHLVKSPFEGKAAIPTGGNHASGLSDHQIAICRQMNVSPDAYAKNISE